MSKTNLNLANAYKGPNNVSKILLGGNLVWPQTPLIQFETTQLAGTIDFDVVTNTPYIGVTVNRGADASIFLYTRTISAIRAFNGYGSPISETYSTSGSHYKSYFIPAHKLPTETKYHHTVSLPLVAKRSVTVGGNHSSTDFYLGDTSSGYLYAEVSNLFGGEATFEVKITPGVTVATLNKDTDSVYNTASSTTLTKVCPAKKKTKFNFNSLIGSSGDGKEYTIRIKDMSTGESISTTSKIKHQYNRSLGVTKGIQFGEGSGQGVSLVAGDGEDGSLVSIYGLEADEALNALFGGTGVIELRYVESPELTNEVRGYATAFYGYSGFLAAKIRRKAASMPPNTRIAVYYQYQTEWQMPIFDVISDSAGNIDRLEPPQVRYNDLSTDIRYGSDLQYTIPGAMVQDSIGVKLGAQTTYHNPTYYAYNINGDVTDTSRADRKQEYMVAGNYIFFDGRSMYVTYDDEPEFTASSSSSNALWRRLVDPTDEIKALWQQKSNLSDHLVELDSGDKFFSTADVACFVSSSRKLGSGFRTDPDAVIGDLFFGEDSTDNSIAVDGGYTPSNAGFTIAGIDGNIFGSPGGVTAFASETLTDNDNIEGKVVSLELREIPIRSIDLVQQKDLAIVQSHSIEKSSNDRWPNYIDEAYEQGRTSNAFRYPNTTSNGITTIYNDVRGSIPSLVNVVGSKNVFRFHDSNTNLTYFPGENRDPSFSAATYLNLRIVNDFVDDKPDTISGDEKSSKSLPCVRWTIAGYDQNYENYLYRGDNDNIIKGGERLNRSPFKKNHSQSLTAPAQGLGYISQYDRTDISQADKETFYIKFEGISRRGPNGYTKEWTNYFTPGQSREHTYFAWVTYVDYVGNNNIYPPARPLQGRLEITLTEDYSEYDFGGVGMTVSQSGSTAIVKLTNVKEGYGANLLIRHIT